MATLTKVALPARMRCDAILARGMTAAPLAVVHVGQSAIVLRDQASPKAADTLLTLTPETSGLMPGGVCLGVTDFHRVRREIQSRQLEGCEIVLAGWDRSSITLELVSLCLRGTPISREVVLRHEEALRDLLPADSSLSSMSPDPIRRKAPSLARQAIDGSVRTESLRAIVGAGPGTTPSGDDVLVGVLAGLRVLELDEQSAALVRGVTPLIPATTAASRHYLSAATEGRFGEHVHDLVTALAKGDSPAQTLRRAAGWGATSGTDLLVGFIATLAISLTDRSIESAA